MRCAWVVQVSSVLTKSGTNTRSILHLDNDKPLWLMGFKPAMEKVEWSFLVNSGIEKGLVVCSRPFLHIMVAGELCNLIWELSRLFGVCWNYTILDKKLECRIPVDTDWLGKETVIRQRLGDWSLKLCEWSCDTIRQLSKVNQIILLLTLNCRINASSVLTNC
jgi:hypothetical protein